MTPPRKQTATEQKPRRYAPRLPPEERREQLLDATLSLIAEKGYESVSMEGIARKAGVTKPVVYDLFGSLADLLEALLEREEERALNQLAELMPTPAEDADPAKVLVDGLDAFLRAIETRPDAWRLSLMPIEAQPGIVREHVERDRTAVAKQLASIVRWGVERLERADLRRRPARPDHHHARRAGRAAPPRRSRELFARSDHRFHRQPAR